MIQEKIRDITEVFNKELSEDRRNYDALSEEKIELEKQYTRRMTTLALKHEYDFIKIQIYKIAKISLSGLIHVFNWCISWRLHWHFWIGRDKLKHLEQFQEQKLDSEKQRYVGLQNTLNLGVEVCAHVV